MNVLLISFAAVISSSEFRSLSHWKSCLESSRRNNKKLVVDFTAAWCGQCRFMEPALGEFVTKYPDVEFVKIDVDRLPTVAKEFEVQIMPMVELMGRCS
ncbi:Thioredoxin H2 [Linum perenne]